MARVGRCAAFAGLLLLAAACGGGGGGTTPSVLPTPTETPSGFAYLQDVSGTSAAVCHQSSQPDAYRAQWSLAAQPGAPLGEVVEPQAVLQHMLRLGPLTPDTAYRYRVRTSAGTLLAEGSFRTPPPPLSRAVTFAAISDSGWPGGAEGQVAEAIRSSTPELELLLHCGDVVYPSGGREGYAPWLFAPFARVIDHAPLFAAVGNHDLETEKGAPWLAAFVTPANNAARDERHYSFDWGDLHVLVLDVASGVCRAGGSQWGFASEDLSLARGAWKIVVLHYPPYSTGPSGGNADVVRHLVPLFESRRVDVVLSGHDHTYQRFEPRNGVLYLVTGGGGAPPDPLKSSRDLAFARSANHFLRGRADATALRLEAVDLAGVVFDQVELRR